MTNWSNETVLTFLEMYEEEAVIWNPNSPLHKDKSAVNEAWNRISTVLEKPVIVLKRKKESLMTTYRLLLKKHKNLSYQPTWFAYDIMDRFLRQIYEGEDITINENEHEQYEQSVRDPAEDKIIPTQCRKRSFALQRRRSNSAPEIQETCKQMRQAINRLNDVLDDKQVGEEDECELFGKLITKKLRKFSDNDREEIMYEIQGLLFDRSRRSPSSPTDKQDTNATGD